jgi:hypothetical protein
MKNFVVGLVVILAIIAIVVLVKRISGNDEILANPDSASEQNTSTENADVLPQ